MFIDIFNTKNKYAVIYADPPWSYPESGGGHRGTAGMPYNSMTTDDICNLPIPSIAADRSILFIWATFPKLKDCLKVIEAWGFSYYGLGFDWTKTGKSGKPCYGMGYYTRQNNEVCLIGVKRDRIKPKDRSHSGESIAESPMRSGRTSKRYAATFQRLSFSQDRRIRDGTAGETRQTFSPLEREAASFVMERDASDLCYVPR